PRVRVPQYGVPWQIDNTKGCCVANSIHYSSPLCSGTYLPPQRTQHVQALARALNRLIWMICAFAALSCLIQSTASAQSQFATLSGTVHDSSGAAVRGA